MIECKDILALCDRFQGYLSPLDIHILRQRYNGKILKSTVAVARDMHLSDETVRTIEHRALAMLDYCLQSEANGQPIIPIRLAKSFRQPVASLICRGLWRSASCAAYTAYRGELLIFASRKPMEIQEFQSHLYVQRYAIEHMIPYTRGAIIGRVLLTDCSHLGVSVHHPRQWMMQFEQPELFPEPIRYSGHRSFFRIDAETAQRLPPRYAYQIPTKI